MQSLLKYIEEKFGPEERSSWVQTHIQKGLLALEKLLKGFAGRYATGDSLYMIAVAANRYNIDLTKYPTLNRIHESYKTLPQFVASAPEKQPDAVR
ncbi:Glutathione S-transferase zeta class [Linum perenne]